MQEVICHLDLRKHFFSDRVTDRWNKLGERDVDSEGINGFKNRLN